MSKSLLESWNIIPTMGVAQAESRNEPLVSFET